MLDKIVAIVLLGIIPVTLQVSQDSCIISTSPTRWAPQPLVLSQSQTGLTFLYPSGPNINYLEVRKSQNIILACPGPNNYIKFNDEGTTQVQVIYALCRGNNIFDTAQFDQYNSISFNVDDIACTIHPKSKEIHESKCFENGVNIHLGYEIDNQFLSHINVCFDKTNYQTYYSHHELRKESSYRQPVNKNRPFYWARGIYHHIQIGKAYEVANIENQNSWSRGHLAPKADFFYDDEKEITFWYVNSAPQIYSFNAGNWKTLEEDIRNFAGKNQLDLDVYTGVYGQLKTIVNGKEEPFYLRTGNGVTAVPVPLYFWKIIYDPKRKLGTAFVGFNYPTTKKPNTDVFICGDIANKISWLTWEANNVKKGLSYACSIRDIREAIASIPDLDVHGILM